MCGKFFSELSNLRKHEKIHTGERPFTCKYCAKSFGVKRVLQRHIRTKHEQISENKPHFPLDENTIENILEVDTDIVKLEVGDIDVPDTNINIKEESRDDSKNIVKIEMKEEVTND